MTTPDFIRSTRANLHYWRRQVDDPDPDAQATLELDWANVVRAIRCGFALQDTVLEAAELTIAAFGRIERRGLWNTWIQLLRQALTHRATLPLTVQCRLLDHLGFLLRQDWQLDIALTLHQEQEALAVQLGDDQETAWARTNMSEDFRYLHDYASADAMGRLALAFYAARPDLASHYGAALNILGQVAWARGDLETACDHLTAVVLQTRQQSSPIQLARALNNLGNVLAERQNPESALACLDEAAALLEPTDAVLDKVMVANSAGTMLYRIGRHHEAEHYFRQADSYALRQTDLYAVRAQIANNLGNVLIAQGQVDTALETLQGSVRLFRLIENPLHLAVALGSLGEAQVKAGDCSHARETLEESLNLLARFPDNAWAQRLHAQYTTLLGSLAA